MDTHVHLCEARLISPKRAGHITRKTLLRTSCLCMILHDGPIDPIPPPLQIRSLSPDSVVPQIGVLPRVDAEDGLGVVVAWSARVILIGSGVSAKGADKVCRFRLTHKPLRGPHGGGVGRHVDLLGSEVRLGQGGAGKVGTQQLHLAFRVVLDDPDEAGAEHGVGGLNQLGTEDVEAGEGLFDLGPEGGGWFGPLRGEAGEEDVVVGGHGGVVEEGGFVSGSAIFFDEGFGCRCRVGGALE